MTELEKILDEIDRRIDDADRMIDGRCRYGYQTALAQIRKVVAIQMLSQFAGYPDNGKQE